MGRVSRRQFVGLVGAGAASFALVGTAEAARNPFPNFSLPDESRLFPNLGNLPSVSQAPSPSSPQTWNVNVGVETSDMAVQGMGFYPIQLFVNVGDTVVWTIQSSEFHTVTFLPPHQQPPPFNPGDPNQAAPQGGSTYDGTGYFNSGLLFKGQSYQLTMGEGAVGDHVYFCLVHSMMRAVLHVRPAGTPYPYGQTFSNALGQMQSTVNLSHGQVLQLEAKAFALSNGNLHQVITGIGDGTAAIMRFIPDTITVKVGDTVVFTVLDTETPHTVTFGEDLNENEAFPPSGDPTNYSGGNLNSGYLGMNPAWFGPTFAVTFTAAGTYPYMCALHDGMGMTGTVTVNG